MFKKKQQLKLRNQNRLGAVSWQEPIRAPVAAPLVALQFVFRRPTAPKPLS